MLRGTGDFTGRADGDGGVRPLLRDDDATKALYQAARQQSPISVMFQLGDNDGQLMGVYLKSVVPEVPEFDDGKTGCSGDSGHRGRRGRWTMKSPWHSDKRQEDLSLRERRVWWSRERYGVTFALRRCPSDGGWS